jgi:hypothetical protein
MDFLKAISQSVSKVFSSLKTLSEAYIYTNTNRKKNGAVFENEYTTVSGDGFFLNRQDNERQLGAPNIPNRLQQSASLYVNSDDFKLNELCKCPQITGKISVKGFLWSITNIDVTDFYFRLDLEK